MSRLAGTLALPLVALFAMPAPAQTPVESLQKLFDDVARGLNYVGRRATDIIPGLDNGEEQKAAHTQTRPFTARYPTSPAPTISIVNEFGAIRVNTWEDRVVQVNAEIKVGADKVETAQEIAQGIEIRVASNADLVEIKTFLPDTRNRAGLVTMEVNYDLTIPSGAALVSDNFFGDTVVRGVSGAVAIESQYGVVDLANLTGDVKVRCQGEFPLKATGLARGGAFELHGTQAEFANVGGKLLADSFRGSVTLRDLAPQIDADIHSDNGPVTLVLPPEGEPDLSVSVLYGGLESALPMDQSAQGRKLAARLPKPDASQRVSLAAVFGDVRIQRVGGQGAPAPQRAQDAKPFNDVITRAVPLPANAPLRIEAMTGDLRVEGIDGTEVRITATRIVWMPSAAQAPTALEALGVTNEVKDGKLVVATKPTADLGAMGCSSYRVDLVVQCPRGAPVEIAAENGLTRIVQLDGTITAVQAAGGIQAEDTGGALTLNVEKGDIRVQKARGAVTANAKYGALLLQEIGGALNTTATEAKIIVEAARGPVTVRNTGGDVRILALDGIGGAFDVKVENGLLSLVMGNKADANVHAIAQNGAVHSGVQLEGTITRTTQDFHGRLLNGTHAVRLETKNGDILLD